MGWNGLLRFDTPYCYLLWIFDLFFHLFQTKRVFFFFECSLYSLLLNKLTQFHLKNLIHTFFTHHSISSITWIRVGHEGKQEISLKMDVALL